MGQQENGAMNGKAQRELRRPWETARQSTAPSRSVQANFTGEFIKQQKGGSETPKLIIFRNNKGRCTVPWGAGEFLEPIRHVSLELLTTVISRCNFLDTAP